MTITLTDSMREQLIEEKVSEWESKKKEQKEDYPFIALSRDFGCGEEKLIPLLEKHFGWKVYGRNLMDHIAQRDALNRSFIETLDEQHTNQMEQWINYLIKAGTLLPGEYIIKISKLMRVITTHESAIFLGRGSQYILADKPRGLRVKLTAPFEVRVENTVRIREMPREEAEALVKKTDQERREFIHQHFEKDWECPHDFDVVLNTATFSEEVICHILSELLEAKRNRGA